MPRRKAQLKCPKCQTAGQWENTREVDAVTLERSYRCTKCTHEFATVERVTRSGTPDAYVLDPRAPRPRAFDERFIETNLHTHLKKLLTTSQRDRVTQIMLVELPEALPRLKPITDREFVGVTAPVYRARDIREVVQSALTKARQEADPALAEQFMAAEAMYRLTELEITVPDFAKWLRAHFNLRVRTPTASKASQQPAEIWRRPPGRVPQPTTVVKNFRDTQPAPAPDESALIPDEDRAARRPRREHVPFNSDQFGQSVLSAIGRETHRQPVNSSAALARLVSSWVLWSCEGQTVVRSSQLAAYAAGVLRRAAPVAYLRWTLLGKELQVREMFEEARAIIESPPDGLLLQEPTYPRGLRSPKGDG